MKLTNTDFVYFCQQLLGAPYWYNTSVIKATRNAYKVNSVRFPEEYSKRDADFYEKSIAEHEIVTDTLGLIKGFAWSNGGKEILAHRGDEIVHTYKVGTNGCPDKSVNGLFIWATTQDINWGKIETLPEVPGLILTNHGRLAIYEGNGYVIEANKELGYVNREPISDTAWRFWYELPFIDYAEAIKIVEKAIPPEEIEIRGTAIAIKNVLVREGKSEDSKFLTILEKNGVVRTYNDSDESLLHIQTEEEEGYAPAELFIYFPEKPHMMSQENPVDYDTELRGEYILIQNASIRNKPAIRSSPLVVIPEGTVIQLTGGFTDNWAQVYAEYNDRIYVGYVNKKYVKKVVIVEVETQEKKED